MDKKHIVLIVDDTPENLRLLGDMLEHEGYEVMVATSGADALQNAMELPRPELILLDIMMPDMDGYEVCRRLKGDPDLNGIPVIFISALYMPEQKIQAFREGAVDYVTKPFQAEEVLARVKTHIQLKLYRDNLQLLVEQRTRELLLAREATIAGMAIMAEFRDTETGEHIQRTKHYVRLLAQELNKSSATPMSPENIELLFQCVPLHDIGKVAVPDSILNKQATLTETEFEEVKKHTQYGTEVIRRTEAVLGSSSFLEYARELAENHHERWDGSGYPRGLKGADIPVCARLMMLADIYDSLIAKRPYKGPLSHEVAFRIITEGDGRTMPEHFDPDVLKAFCRLHQEFDRITREFSASKQDVVKSMDDSRSAERR